MHSYQKKMKPLSPGPTLCLSLSLTLAHLNFLVGDGNFPPAEALGGVWGYWDKMQGSGWCWPDGGHTGPHHLVTSCPMVRVRHSSIRPKTTWEPEEGKGLLFLKNKKFYSSVKPAKHFVRPRKGTSPAWRLLQTMRLLELIQNIEKRPQESPQAWRAGWPNGSCWDNVRWYKDEFAIGNGGRREGPLWISNTQQCPVQQLPKRWDGASKDGQKEKSIVDVGN